jgi:peptidoglycan/xylan/chitin deacetylase (PgdA/CDA1 family)
MIAVGAGLLAACLLAAPASAASANAASPSEPRPPCDKPVYLTFDTGHMGVAQLVADLLHKYRIRATFFAANEKTLDGEGSLSPAWQAWWAARGKEGHEFASHTLNHTYWRADLPGDKPVRFVVRPSQGALAGRTMTWTEAQYCEEIQTANDRLKAYTGKEPLALYRAPGGKTSPRLLAAAERCGYKHVGWSPAGFLGDELPSDTYPNDRLLVKAVKEIRPGDILLAHLGIWSRKDPWAPAVLEPLIVDLRARGFCFATLREHPDLRPWLRAKGQ